MVFPFNKGSDYIIVACFKDFPNQNDFLVSTGRITIQVFSELYTKEKVARIRHYVSMRTSDLTLSIHYLLFCDINMFLLTLGGVFASQN